MKELIELINLEGDAKNFDYKGFECRIRRVAKDYSGHLCGYVVIPREHELYQVDYHKVERDYDYDLPSHCGLTFSDYCENGEWWLGFDCAHLGDIQPFSKCNIPSLLGDEYRTMEYVEKTLKNMIDFMNEYSC